MTELRKFNRINAHRIAKSGKSWCGSCDRALVGVGQKCPVCGKREKRVDKKSNYSHRVTE